MSKNLEPIKLSRRAALGLVAYRAWSDGAGRLRAERADVAAGRLDQLEWQPAPPRAQPRRPRQEPLPQPKSGGTLRIADRRRRQSPRPALPSGRRVLQRLRPADAVRPSTTTCSRCSPRAGTSRRTTRRSSSTCARACSSTTAPSWTRTRSSSTASARATCPNTQLDEAKWWTSIETPDKYTVIFKSDKPRPLAFDFFEFLNIAEPTSANDPTKAVGTGPFKFVEWKQNDSLTLAKNPNYWQSGKPYLDGIQHVDHHRSAGDGHALRGRLARRGHRPPRHRLRPPAERPELHAVPVLGRATSRASA